MGGYAIGNSGFAAAQMGSKYFSQLDQCFVVHIRSMQIYTIIAMYFYTFFETHCFLVRCAQLVQFYTVSDSGDIFTILEDRRKALGLSQAQVSERAFNRSDTSPIQNIRRGSSPSADKLRSLASALDLEFYFGPRRKVPAPGPREFSDAKILPHRGMAKCSLQGWSDDQPDLPELPAPVFINDPQAFYVSAAGQSMAPEGIEPSSICLVSPAQDLCEGDRIWIKDKAGLTTIKRLTKIGERSLYLRGWMPIKDGSQQSFSEERVLNYIDKAWPVVAVFKGKPGENATFIPDPKGEADKMSAVERAESLTHLTLNEHHTDAGKVDHRAISTVALPSIWLSRNQINGGDASLVFVAGDSMSPTIPACATVLINKAATIPVHRRVYAFLDDGTLFVNRLESPSEGILLIHSDNTNHATRVLSGSEIDRITVLGEVVWSGGLVV